MTIFNGTVFNPNDASKDVTVGDYTFRFVTSRLLNPPILTAYWVTDKLEVVGTLLPINPPVSWEVKYGLVDQKSHKLLYNGGAKPKLHKSVGAKFAKLVIEQVLKEVGGGNSNKCTG